MKKDITERWKYIGGSDIPIIMGLSPFKTRWQLLQEKAQLAEPTFEGNRYTEYGNLMEPKIREYCNKKLNRNFAEDMQIKGEIRYNADGYDGEHNELLEIKTTSQIHESVADYKHYVVQLLAGMEVYKTENGHLAVYERPEDFDENEDFNEDFDPDRLAIFPIATEQFSIWRDEIREQVDRFIVDLKRLKENPFLTEEDLQPKEVVEYANAVIILEQQLAMARAIEEESKKTKAQLKEAMQKYGIKTWTTPNGTKITLVPDGEDKTVQEFDEKAFKAAQPDVYNQYTKEKMEKGRAGYVRITLKE